MLELVKTDIYGNNRFRMVTFYSGDVIKVSVKNVIMDNGQSKDFEYEVLPFNPNPEKKTYVLSRN
jgi:hypothetical protein